jgi:hypothetical protein
MTSGYTPGSMPEKDQPGFDQIRAGEGAKVRERERSVGELSTVMRANGRDSTPIKEAIGGLDVRDLRSLRSPHMSPGPTLG